MITIIFGNPGSGKSSLMSCLACALMNHSFEDLAACHAKIDSLNSCGYTLSKPKEHLVYSDQEITTEPILMPSRSSRFVNGFHLGLPNFRHPTHFLPPNAKVFLMEAQKYYNSRMSQWFPNFVSRFYETHRHYGLDIFLDCQRSGLIDLNIRGIAGEFVEVVRLEHLTKKGKFLHKVSNAEYNPNLHGQIVKCRWITNVYTDCYAVEKMLKNAEKSDEVETRIYEYNGNIFKTYDSFFLDKLHLNGRDFDDFDLDFHPNFGSDKDSIKAFNAFYNYQAADTFYEPKNKTNFEENKEIKSWKKEIQKTMK